MIFYSTDDPWPSGYLVLVGPERDRETEMYCVVICV